MTDDAKRWLRRGAQVLLFVAVGWYAVQKLGGDWAKFRSEAGSLRPAWGILVASCAVVLATYALLIEAWRRLMGTAGARIRFGRAAWIWLVSSLGRVLPGRVWQIGAMSALAQREGVPPSVAAGAAILNTLVNIAASFAVLGVSGARALPQVVPGGGRAAAVLVVLSVLGLLLLPVLVPWAYRRLARRSSRAAEIEIAPRALWASIVSNLLAWLLYGLAFHLFALAVLRRAPGSWTDSVAVFTGSYLAGYLAVFVPAGLVAREAAMVAALTGLQLATAAEATVLALASRLWLTVLEVLPGTLLLLRDTVTRPSRPKP